MKDCVQWFISVDTETGASNCLTGINNAVSKVSSAWENKANKNSNNKGQDINNPGKYVVSGIMRMSNPDEKTSLINAIKGMGNNPHIVGKIRVHPCSHFSWKCLECNHVWDSMELPPTSCPSCGNSNPFKLVGNVFPCEIIEIWKEK